MEAEITRLEKESSSSSSTTTGGDGNYYKLEQQIIDLKNMFIALKREQHQQLTMINQHRDKLTNLNQQVTNNKDAVIAHKTLIHNLQVRDNQLQK